MPEQPETPTTPKPLPIRDPGATFRQPAATTTRPEQPNWARHHPHHDD